MIDELRADAKASIDALHRMGMQIAMLSGDKQEAAEAVAARIGIDQNQVLICSQYMNFARNYIS